MGQTEIRPNSISMFVNDVCYKRDVVQSYFDVKEQDIDCSFIAQTYSSISKVLLSENVNTIIIHMY